MECNTIFSSLGKCTLWDNENYLITYWEADEVREPIKPCHLTKATSMKYKTLYLSFCNKHSI